MAEPTDTTSAIKREQRPIRVLLFGVLLMHLGNYMVIPLLPIYLGMEKGLHVVQIGAVLAVSPFAFLVGSLLGGWLADRFGRRFIISIGAWIQTAALLGYIVNAQFVYYMAISALSGLGIGLTAPAVKAAMAALTAADQSLAQVFSWRGIAANIGIAAAGLFTYFILGGPSPLIFYTASALFAVLALTSGMMLPAGCGDEPCKSSPLGAYKQVLRNRAFVGLSIVSFFVWALYTQLSLSLPLKGERILEDPGAVSLIWTANSIMVIALQSFITRRVIERRHPMIVMSFGVLFFGAGLCLLGWANSWLMLLICGVVFIVGEMMVMPTMDSVVSRLGTLQAVGVYFGSANLISGLGESSGKYMGGVLLERGINTAYPWILYAIVAIIVSVALVALRHWKPLEAIVSARPREQGISRADTAGQSTAAANIRSDESRLPWRKKRSKT